MKKVLGIVALIAIVSCQQGYYCDQWNKCADGYYCYNKKCQVIACPADGNCGTGFTCDNGHCDPLQHAEPGRYCDQWTPCSNDQQCFKNRCAALLCWDWNQCPEGMVCQRDHCIQFTPVCQQTSECTGGPGYYCDRGKCCPPPRAHQIPCWVGNSSPV